MKQRMRIIPLLCLALGLCIFVGFDRLSGTTDVDENTKQSNSVMEIEIFDNSSQTALNEQVSNEVVNSEVLLIEDKIVKSEISKYSNTTVDFRYNKQETIQGKEFNLTFEKIDSLNDYKRTIYTNDSCDEFVYNTDNGKLRYAVIESAVTEKVAESIDKAAAKKKAEEYVFAKCNISDYTIDQEKETDKGYYFCFTRYIATYPSNDRYSVQIGYDGSIVYISDFTDTFDGKNINYDKAFIDAKIKEHSDETKVDWSSVTVRLEEGKVAVSYTVDENNAVYVLPLED